MDPVLFDTPWNWSQHFLGDLPYFPWIPHDSRARQEEVVDLGHDGTHRIHGEDQVTGQDAVTKIQYL